MSGMGRNAPVRAAGGRRTTVVYGLAATFCVCLALTSCYLDELTAPPADESTIEFSIAGDSVLLLGDSVLITSSFEVGDGTGVTRVVWMSRDTLIAKVDETSGIVVGVAAGTTEIAAHLVAPELDNDVVRVLPIEVVYAGIGMTNDSLTGLGETRSLEARGLDVYGVAHDVVPASFSTQDDSIVSLDTMGVVVALKNGQAVIRATWDTLSVQSPILVRQVAGRIDVNVSQLMFPTLQMDTTVTVEVRDTQDSIIFAPQLTWVSPDATKFSVTPAGVIRALRREAGVITVSSDTVTAQLAVTVASSVTTLSVVGGDGQSAAVNSPVAIPPSVIARDGAGTPIANALVTFAVFGSEGRVTDAVKLTDASGVAQVGAWVLGTRAGLDSLTATADTVSYSFMATALPGPLSPTMSIVTVASDTIAAGTATTITVGAIDAFGNAVTSGGGNIAFSTSGGSSTGSVGATTDNGDGTYSASFTGQGAGSPTTINTTINGDVVTTNRPTVTVVPGPATQIAIMAGNNQTGLVGSLIFVPPTVLVTDDFGNPVPAVSVTFAVTGGGGTIGGSPAFSDASGVATLGSWTLGGVVGANTVTATVGSSTVNFSASGILNTASVTTSLITSSLDTVLAGAVALLTVQTKDQFGNDLTTGGFTVAFSVGGGSSTGSIGPTIDVGDGTYTATFTGALAGLPATIGATVNGAAITTPQPSITVLPGAVSPNTSVLTVTAGSVIAGQTAVLTLDTRDAFGNDVPVGGHAVVFNVSGGSSVGLVGIATDNGDGSYSAVFAGQVAGTSSSVGATIDGAPVSSTEPTVTVVPGAFSSGNSTLTVSNGTIASGTSTTVTLVARDSFGNALITGGHAVVFAATGGTSTVNIGGAVDHGDGTYSATITSIAAGTPTTITGSVDGQAVSSALPTVTVVPGVAAIITINDGDGQFALPGTQVLIAPSVSITDGNGNPGPGEVVSFVVTAGGGFIIPNTAVTTGSDGIARLSSWTLGLGLLGNRLRATASPGSVEFVANAILSFDR